MEHGKALCVCLAAALIGGAITVGATGCGDDNSEGAVTGPTASVGVTRDFGRQELTESRDVALGGRGTLVSTLRDGHDVRVVSHGWHVTDIDGLRDNFPSDVDESIWLSYVNGVETDVRPTEYQLYDGDVVQWDLRDWYVTLDVRATVGAFPETFTRGVFGGLFGVRVVCAEPASSACLRVKRLLRRAGVPIDGARPRSSHLPPPGNPRRATVMVGDWRHVRHERWAFRVDQGPRYSGIFARFSPGGRALRLLDWNAHRVRTEGAGTGLVGAFRPTEEALVWVVTGVDDDGVERAAAALDSADLRDAFAAVVTADGVERVPLEPRR